MDTLNKTKTKTIIKTLLLAQPEKEWTSKELSKFINSYDYRLNKKVTPNIIGQLIRAEKTDGKSFLNDITVEKQPDNTYRYRIRTGGQNEKTRIHKHKHKEKECDIR